jgi:hypothetical protein
MRDISGDAFEIAAMVPWVRVRFIEAVDTADHSYRGDGPAGAGSYWPAIATVLDTDPDAPKPWRPSRDAITRAEETLAGWLIDFVEDREHRWLLLNWSASIANPKRYGSFAKNCKKSGRARSTAYHRLDAAFVTVATLIRKNGKSLQEPDMHRVGQLARVAGMDLGKMDDDRLPGRPSGSPSFWRTEDAAPANDFDERRRQMAERKAG